MKVYILTDLEGVGGVISPNQTFEGKPGYERAREWLTHDVNAAVEGALAGGATEVLVLDGHGANGACNFIYDKLHPGAEYIQGTPWTEYLQSFDESFGALFMVGAHAMAGTQGAVLEHTMSSLSWVEMRINGQPMGEIGLGAAIGGHFGVPFAMVSGDDKACREAADICPGIECAVVKEGISRTCARLLPMPVVRERIVTAAANAIRKAEQLQPFDIGGPVQIEIEYFRNDMVDGVMERDGVQRVGPRMMLYTGDNVIQAFNRIRGA